MKRGLPQFRLIVFRAPGVIEPTEAQKYYDQESSAIPLRHRGTRNSPGTSNVILPRNPMSRSLRHYLCFDVIPSLEPNMQYSITTFLLRLTCSINTKSRVGCYNVEEVCSIYIYIYIICMYICVYVHYGYNIATLWLQGTFGAYSVDL